MTLSRQIITPMLLGLFLAADGASVAVQAGLPGLQLRLHRPPDVPLERLDRPLRDSDRPPKDSRRAQLTQADAIKAAKAELKEEVGKTFRDYAVKTALFDPERKEWSITFDPPPATPAIGCITVFVDDETSETMLLHCR